MVTYKLEYVHYTCMIPGSFVIHGTVFLCACTTFYTVIQGYLGREYRNPMSPVNASLVGA